MIEISLSLCTQNLSKYITIRSINSCHYLHAIIHLDYLPEEFDFQVTFLLSDESEPLPRINAASRPRNQIESRVPDARRQ